MPLLKLMGKKYWFSHERELQLILFRLKAITAIYRDQEDWTCILNRPSDPETMEKESPPQPSDSDLGFHEPLVRVNTWEGV